MVVERLLNRILRLVCGEAYLNAKNKRKAIERLHKYGDEVIHKIMKIERETGTQFDLSFGTLLGAYREHGFIAHDDDVDLIMEIKYLSVELLGALRNEGFELNELFITSDYRGCQLPMKYKGLTCDIYVTYIEPDGHYHTYVPHPIYDMDWAYCGKINLYKSRDIIIPYFSNRVEQDYNGYKVLIPENSKEILSHTYGEDFMTPKKGVITKVAETSMSQQFFVSMPLSEVLNEGVIEKLKQYTKTDRQ